jgi:hypothetical protein
MKKRIITDDQYPTKPWIFRYITNEEHKIRSEARKKYTDSSKYKATDFPKLRTYVILVRVLSTGQIYAYCDDTHTNGLPVSASRCKLFKNSPKHHDDRLFTLRNYREDYNGPIVKVTHWLNKNMPDVLHDKSKFDMFISRVGSKNCPVKIKLSTKLKNQIRATFKVK